MPALPLSQEQLEDAARLKALFQNWQREQREAGLPASQEDAAERMGFGQSALAQYLNGRIPLNVEAGIKFAKLLKVPFSDFSPLLAGQAEKLIDQLAARDVIAHTSTSLTKERTEETRAESERLSQAGSIHERIRARRISLGLTYEKLAEAIHAATGKKIAWQAIQLWEKEGGTAPSRSNQAAAAKGLRCSVEWLVAGVGTPEDPVDLLPTGGAPEAPPVDRMILQYVSPREAALLEHYRLSYEDGRKEIEIAAELTDKRPLSLIRSVNDA